jgi:phytoene desaturase
MVRKCDVLIIGSGLGGMAAGVSLAKVGYSILIVESRDRVGGRFSTIDYEGFELPTGAVLPTRSGWVPKILEYAGVNAVFRDVSRMFYRIGIEGREYEMPSKGRLAVLLDIIEKTRAGGAEVADDKILKGFREAIGGRETPQGLSFRDWLIQYTENEMVHHVFDQFSVSVLMAHSWEIPAGPFFTGMSKSKGARDSVLPAAPETNLTIMEKLAGVVKTTGNVWLNCPAKQIVVTKGIASGVVIEKNGKDIEILCRAVISNVGPRRTVELAGRENFTEEYLKELRVKMRPSPCVLIYITNDKPLWNVTETGALLTIIGGRRFGTIIPLTNTCPELAPSGQHLIYASAEPLSSLLPFDAEYERQQCILDIKEMFPEFEKHGRILRMEPRNVDHDFPEARTWSGYEMSVETPVPNLFNVGDAVLETGILGTSGATESGVRVSELVRKQVKLV